MLFTFYLFTVAAYIVLDAVPEILMTFMRKHLFKGACGAVVSSDVSNKSLSAEVLVELILIFVCFELHFIEVYFTNNPSIQLLNGVGLNSKTQTCVLSL